MTTNNISDKITINFDVQKIREDFPILKTQVRGKPLIYFDNAATTQKPIQVIERIQKYYLEENSNVHRGVHFLSELATKEYESARVTVKNFINADSIEEIIFTRGTTEAINLVANSFGKTFIDEGDEIIISEMEHHSNIVPWQILCEERKAKLKIIPFDDNGELILDELENLITERTKLISLVHISNSLGTINPIKKIIEIAHSYAVPVLIDGAQSIMHNKINVQELGCDFFVFSGHKIYGPTGIGVLYGKKDLLEQMLPYQGGGDMIKSVTFEKTIYNDLPYKFEAGTPNIEGAIGLKAAIDYLNTVGLDHISIYENELLQYATERLSQIPQLKIIGTAKEKASIISFILENIHPHDVGTILDFEGIAVRTGHHCTQPVMQHFKVPATTRASLSFYNTKEEIDQLFNAIQKVIKVFS
ncbi:MAG: cysteine desulfurase [Ignavibacteria bacterium]|jgi:cysteine desulfurase/selenocysteine lyase|nr:cysteine desulfurase [Ignavibacteria bacterium]MDH7526736.1 cysteine desulfurase [Ignavibacteria bacterium]